MSIKKSIITIIILLLSIFPAKGSSSEEWLKKGLDLYDKRRFDRIYRLVR